MVSNLKHWMYICIIIRINVSVIKLNLFTNHSIKICFLLQCSVEYEMLMMLWGFAAWCRMFMSCFMNLHKKVNCVCVCSWGFTNITKQIEYFYVTTLCCVLFYREKLPSKKWKSPQSYSRFTINTLHRQSLIVNHYKQTMFSVVFKFLHHTDIKEAQFSIIIWNTCMSWILLNH